MENIWTSFRKELGFVTASIQYVELALRIAKSEKEKELSENLQAIAKQHKLYVSIIPEDISIRIAKNYIIQIHSCIERFLYDYHRLKGSATHNLKYDKEKDNFLHWTMEHALAEKTSKYERHYRICDYYRYVRNDSIHHDDKISVQLKATYSVAKKIKEERLSAPNQLEKLQFDDQVLFARSARELIKAIYYESQYDWKTIVSAHKDDIKELIKSYSGNDSKERRIKNYLNCFYPIPAEGIANLMEMI